ncbi:MAG: STAS domain-containing protein [Rubrivivax sp.]
MKLPDDASIEHVTELAAQLPQSLESSQGTWQIDASALKAFDSSTIALLLQARRLAKAAGRDIEIIGVPPTLSQLARLYGIGDLLPAAAGDAGAPRPTEAPSGGVPHLG